ncbi:XRE family transcriptional regulator [Christensenellaceae bacterium OttesenSCG-928-L17]|nr:XRE family transcriptional regulator [Christensenellaceae bacterium OttesenSCG-928-L17]
MISASETVSRNMKRIRQERNFTLDDLSALTGVSKSMLSEIERCTKSPTISVLEKICNGIHIPLSQLTYTEIPQVAVVRNNSVKHYSAWEGFELFVLFEFDPERKFELFRHTIAPHSARSSEYHEAGIREYIVCTKGVFSIAVGEQVFHLQEGEAIQFLANCSHTYWNETSEPASIVMMMYHE